MPCNFASSQKRTSASSIRGREYHSLVAATLVEEVKVLDEKAEEGHYDPLAFVCSASATPHRGLQRAAIAAEIAARVHLMLQNRELGGLHLRPLKAVRKRLPSIL